MLVECSHRHLSLSQWRLRIYVALFTPHTPRHSLRFRTDSQRLRHYSQPATEKSDSTRERLRRIKPIAQPRYKSEPQVQVQGRPAVPGLQQKKWTPYSDQGQHDLKSLADTLKGLQFPYLPKDQHSPHDTGPLPNLPASPILKKPLNQKPEPKRQPTAKERALELDPWARILAAPLRACGATMVRFPVALLSDWGLVKHSLTGAVHVAPDSLADLDKLGDIRSREVEQRRAIREAVSSIADNKLSSLAGKAAQDELTPSHLPPLAHSPNNPSASPGSTPHNSKKAPSIRILPSTHVMGLMKDHYYFNRFPDDPSSSPERKLSESPGLLLPINWRSSITRARHFDRGRKEVERIPEINSSSQPPVRATIPFRNLQWQADMEERMLNILRRRVLISLRRVIELPAASPAKVHECPVAAMPLLVNVIRNGGSWQAVDASFPAADVDAHGADNGTVGQHRHQYLRSRILLYLSPDTTDARLGNLLIPPTPGMKSTVRHDESGNAASKTNPLLPPLLAPSFKDFQAERRSPVFPLHAMLGPRCYEELIEVAKPQIDLLLSIHQQQPGSSMDTVEQEISAPSELVISVSAADDTTDVLFEEIFRLWRYVGGRACMPSQPSSEV